MNITLQIRVINRHIISYIIVRLLHNSTILCALNICMSCLTLYLVDWYEIVSLCVHRNFILPYSHRCSWLSIILFAWVKITYSIMSSDSDICCPLPWDNNTCIYIATEWKWKYSSLKFASIDISMRRPFGLVCQLWTFLPLILAKFGQI